MTDLELARAYLPIIHFDRAETIPLRAVGYTVFREGRRSESFPKRAVDVPPGAAFVIEYACYWDYDIQHMYDLEHIWVTVGPDGAPIHAEGSFHGKYLNLYDPGLPGLPPEGRRVHAFCQPGKHAFLPEGRLFRLVPGWFECCNAESGGPVLVGGPFGGAYAPTPEEDERCARYIRARLAFEPTMDFSGGMPEDLRLMPWAEMAAWIPGRVAAECERLRALEEGETA